MKTKTNAIPLGLMLTVWALGGACLPPAWAQTFTPNHPMLTARWSHTAT